MPDENGGLPQRERAEFHHVLARWIGVQRHHSQTQAGSDPIRETVQVERHIQFEQRVQRGRGQARAHQTFGRGGYFRRSSGRKVDHHVRGHVLSLLLQDETGDGAR